MATRFDRALRTVKEYLETVEYIPMNPVRRGLVKRAEEWKGSSVRQYAQAALALLVTCHSSLVTEEGWMQTNQRADAG